MSQNDPFDRLEERFSRRWRTPEKRSYDSSLGESGRQFRADADMSTFFETQDELRPLFGKSGSVEPSIGAHPDFEHLAGTDDTETNYAVTMFVDIVSSTRLGLIFQDVDALRIKNAFIRTAIEVVTSMDGHVHRLMGDGIMAFFGGKEVAPFNACIDAINAASVLLHFAQARVTRDLQADGFGDDFKIRIGLEYGPTVLWGSYGYPGSEEVTATSFHVDVAAKLQQQASVNRLMIGESLKSLLDLPADRLLTLKTRSVGDDVIADEFVLPNHRDRSGAKVNHRMWHFEWQKYLSWTKLGHVVEEFGAQSVPVSINSNFYGSYLPCSRALKKKDSLEFDFQFPVLNDLEYEVTLKVENRGMEAEEAHKAAEKDEEREILQRTRTETVKRGTRGLRWRESTEYRGLHTLQAIAKLRGKTRFNVTLGVFIE